MTVVRLYFDYISPYAYVGWHLIQRLAKERAIEVVPEPILFAALLNAHGQKGPAEIPAKRGYVFKDAFRKAHAAGLGPLRPPPNHPFNPLLALRATVAVPSEARARAVTSLYAATWGGGGGVESAANVERALVEAGLDGAALLRDATTPEVKATLRAKTEEAIALGVFGVPTVAIGTELFWGVDGLAFVADYLDGRDPVPADLLATWSHLPASASRL